MIWYDMTYDVFLAKIDQRRRDFDSKHYAHSPPSYVHRPTSAFFYQPGMKTRGLVPNIKLEPKAS